MPPLFEQLGDWRDFGQFGRQQCGIVAFAVWVGAGGGFGVVAFDGVVASLTILALAIMFRP